MRIISAFRAKFDYDDNGTYLEFVKKQLLKINPDFYVVTTSCEIQTPDGIMYAIKIDRENIENPTLDPIAHTICNNRHFFLWDNSFWAVANDRDGNQVYREYDHRTRKSFIVYYIGSPEE